MQSILQPVLAQPALFAVNGEHETCEELDGWRKGLMQTLARKMYPNRTVDAAFEHAFDVGRQNHTLAEFLSRVGLAAQQHLDSSLKVNKLILIAAE